MRLGPGANESDIRAGAGPQRGEREKKKETRMGHAIGGRKKTPNKRSINVVQGRYSTRRVGREHSAEKHVRKRPKINVEVAVLGVGSPEAQNVDSKAAEH